MNVTSVNPDLVLAVTPSQVQVNNRYREDKYGKPTINKFVSIETPTPAGKLGTEPNARDVYGRLIRTRIALQQEMLEQTN